MSMSKIKVGDTVRIIAGKDKGREGKVLKIDHEAGRVVVEGANMITKHNKQSAKNPNGGILKVEGTIALSNVMYLKDGKPIPSFVGDPETVAVGDGSAQAIADALWAGLNADNRVSLWVMTRDLTTGESDAVIINRNM